MQRRHPRSSRSRDEPRRERALVGAVLLLVLSFAACASERIVLLTADPSTGTGCYLASTTGMLIPDADAGTAIVSEDMGQTTVAVRWPQGYSGRRNGEQIEVLDSGGAVVARTGQRYMLLGGYSPDGGWAACDAGVYPPPWESPR